MNPFNNQFSFDEAVKTLGLINKAIYGINPYERESDERTEADKLIDGEIEKIQEEHFTPEGEGGHCEDKGDARPYLEDNQI